MTWFEIPLYCFSNRTPLPRSFVFWSKRQGPTNRTNRTETVKCPGNTWGWVLPAADQQSGISIIDTAIRCCSGRGRTDMNRWNRYDTVQMQYRRIYLCQSFFCRQSCWLAPTAGYCCRSTWWVALARGWGQRLPTSLGPWWRLHAALLGKIWQAFLTSS